ncbi:MAG: cation:proton antiporter, partial [Thermoplasmata archaeon]|nr:cation:proton antiporter [Thermoplasmata archaeon]
MVDLESLLFALGVALPLAKILGYAMERIKQPAVIGEIIAGIILGPFAVGKFIEGVNFVSPAICEETEAIAKIGIILLLLLSGIETGIGEIRRAGKSGIITSMFDVSIAFIFGYIVGSILGYDVLHCIA